MARRQRRAGGRVGERSTAAAGTAPPSRFVRRRDSRLSLRRQATIINGSIVVMALVLFAVLSVRQVRATVLERTNTELAATANGLLIPARTQSQRVANGQRPLQFINVQQYLLPDSIPGFAALIDEHGQSLPMPPLAAADYAPPSIPPDVRTLVGRESFTIDGPDGGSLARVVAVPDSNNILFVALSLRSVSATADELARAEAVIGGALIVVFLALSAMVTRVSFRPLEAMTTVASQIASGARGERIRPGQPGTEIGALSAALNHMLDAVEENLEQRIEMQKRTERFAADAAHELRTPVTVLLAYTQLFLAGGVPEADVAAVFARMEHESSRLADLVEGLLLLNRLDLGGHSLEAVEAVDAQEVCEAAVADAMMVAPNYRITIDGPGQVLALAHRDQLFQIIANLLGNVRAHTPAGTSTSVTLSPPSADRPTVTIDVADDGPGIETAARDKVFERFYRADRSRQRNPDGIGGGSGLGLAIVRTLARANNGDAELLDVASHVGTCVRITLPAG